MAKSGRARRAPTPQQLLERGTRDHYEDTALYDHEYADRTDDIDWYVKLADAHVPTGGTMLELGAGTGRITLPIAHRGHRVIALDRMASMLEGLQRRIAKHRSPPDIEVLCADMREIPLPDGSVELVISPFNALMHLYRWQDLLACFREVRRVLRPGGTFSCDVQLPDLDWLGWDPDERHAVTYFEHPTTSERLVYSTNHTYEPQTQICHIRIYYDVAPPRGRKFKPPAEPLRLVHLAHRQIFPEELQLLVHAAGLELVSLTGDFSPRPLARRHESQALVCRRPTIPKSAHEPPPDGTPTAPHRS